MEVEREIGTCQACHTDDVPVKEYGEDRGTCEQRVALCDLCARLLFGNTARHPGAVYVIEDLARDLVTLFRGVFDRLDRIESGEGRK